MNPMLSWLFPDRLTLRGAELQLLASRLRHDSWNSPVWKCKGHLKRLLSMGLRMTYHLNWEQA